MSLGPPSLVLYMAPGLGLAAQGDPGAGQDAGTPAGLLPEPGWKGEGEGPLLPKREEAASGMLPELLAVTACVLPGTPPLSMLQLGLADTAMLPDCWFCCCCCCCCFFVAYGA